METEAIVEKVSAADYLESSIKLPTLDAKLVLSDIFAKVKFSQNK